MSAWWLAILEYDEEAGGGSGSGQAKRRQPVIKATQNVIVEVTSLNLKPDHRGGRRGLWHVAFLAGVWEATPDVDPLARVYAKGRTAWVNLAKAMGATEFGLDPPSDQTTAWSSDYELAMLDRTPNGRPLAHVYQCALLLTSAGEPEVDEDDAAAA